MVRRRFEIVRDTLLSWKNPIAFSAKNDLLRAPGCARGKVMNVDRPKVSKYTAAVHKAQSSCGVASVDVVSET